MKRVINKNKVFYVVMVTLIVLVILVTGIRVVNEFFIRDKKDVTVREELDSVKAYGYTLDDLDSSLYKVYFKELKNVLKGDIDYLEYASVLVKLFVTDFYTLDTKLTSSDIGGVEFVHPDILENFETNAGDTIYNHVKNNVYGDRVQDLPVVSNVNIESVIDYTYKYNENDYEGYKIIANWEYEEDLGYDTKGVFYLIKDNNKLNIVEFTGEL